MAGAAAVSQLANRVFDGWILVLFVRPGFVVVRVTARAIRLKSWRPPIDNLGVRLMAFGALQVVPMILWLVRQRNVAVVCGHPRVRDVAGIAFLRGVKVVLVLADSGNAIVTG